MHAFHLVAKLRQLFKGWCCVHKGLLAQLEGRGLQRYHSVRSPCAREDWLAYLTLVEGLGLNLPLLLEAVNNILVTPADLVRQPL